MATLTDDGEMVYRITNNGFAEKAVYQATWHLNDKLLTQKNEGRQ